VYSRSEVLDKRESKSRANVGIVRVRTTGFTETGRSVIEFCGHSWSTSADTFRRRKAARAEGE
jgi:acyl dehydratase